MLPDCLLIKDDKTGQHTLLRRLQQKSAHSSLWRCVTERSRFIRLILLLCLLCLATACGSKAVATVSSESEAIEIIDVLRENGFDAEKEELGDEGEKKKWQVSINEGWFGSGDATLAMQVLRDHGLPRPDDPGMEKAYDEPGIFPSESAQKAQRLKELKTEVERQLRMLPGVVRVSVNIVLPEDSIQNFNPYPASASVVIVHADEKPAFTAEQVQNSVAGSVSKLKPENVSVTLAQQPHRPVQRREANVHRRNLFIAAGLGVVTLVFSSLLIVLMLQTRRQRAELAQLREEAEGSAQNAEESADDEEEEAAQLPGDEQRWLDHESAVDRSGNGSRALQRADAAGQSDETTGEIPSTQPKTTLE